MWLRPSIPPAHNTYRGLRGLVVRCLWFDPRWLLAFTFLQMFLPHNINGCPQCTTILVHHVVTPYFIILQTPPVCSMMTQCLFKAQSSSPPSCLSTVSQVISHQGRCSKRCTQHCTRCEKYWVGGIWYRIAENFRGRKLSRICGK